MPKELLDYRALFHLIPSPMLVVDTETLAILEVNDAAVRCYGYSREELLAMHATDLRSPEEVPAFLKSFRAHADDREKAVAVHHRWRHRKKDGTEFDVEIWRAHVKAGDRDAELALIYDMTPRQTLEEQLRQAQKVEELGLLAGGVAHDFNNFLTIILGAVDMGRRAVAMGRPTTGALDAVNDAAMRAAELTRKLLAMSRKQVVRLRTLDLNEALGDFGKLIGHVVGEDVLVDVRTTAEPLWIRVDPSQLEQVLLNLCTNARQAMPSGGKLVLEARAGAGPSVELRVSDTGVGMDDATRARMFEPFFTTKERGTGLGLSVVRGIVDQQRADVQVDSKPGEGTTMRVIWPRADEPVARADVSVSEQLSGGPETLLVVEDQPALRALMASALAELGYDVLTTETGEGAVEQIRRQDGKVALAVVDIVLPDIGGDEAFARMRALAPSLKAVFITGYAPERAELAKLLSDHVVLDKPFTFAELARGVRATLDGG